MKLTIAYCRQSFKRANKESSVKWQKEAVFKYAQKLSRSISHYYTDIKSAKNTDRNDFKKMVDLIKNRNIGALFVYRIDRLSRNNKDLLNFLQICAEHDVVIFSVSEGEFDYNKPGDRIKLQILAIVGELQRTATKENRQINNINKFKMGKTVNYVAAFGYRYRKGKFEVNDAEVSTVKFVFEQYIDGLGYKKIAQLTQNTPDLVPRNPAQVRYILLNEKHTGVFKSKYGELNNIVQPIISKETFRTAQAIRKHRAGERIQTHTVVARLRSKIICPFCGSNLTTYHYRKQTNSQPVYCCPRKLSGQYNDCQMRSIPLKKFENNVLQHLVQFLSSKDQLDQLYQEALERIKIKYSRRNLNVKKYLKRKDYLIEQVAEENITVDNFKAQLAMINSAMTQSPAIEADSITPEKIKRLIEIDPSLREDLWTLVKYVRVDEQHVLVDITLSELNINIIEYNRRITNNEK